MTTIQGAEIREELESARAGLLEAARSGRLAPAAVRTALTELNDLLLVRLAAQAGITPDSPYALCAFGGLGRREMLPFSDLDLVLLYDGGGAGRLQDTADALWYPLWDAGQPLDHSVRTPAQCLRLAADDAKVALGMLELRPVAGDPALAGRVREGALDSWRRRVHSGIDELVDSVAARRRRAGAIAHRSEPDLKYGEGGLRDAQVLGALAFANVANDALAVIPNAPGLSVAEARGVVLDVRTCLHIAAGKPLDVLHAQYASDVAGMLGRADRFALARELSGASRTLAFATDLGIRTARGSVPRRGLAALRRAPARTPLAEGVVAHGGEVVLARGARPERDDSLLLRVAAAAARHRLPIAAGTLRRLADSAPSAAHETGPLVLDSLVALLGSGEACIPVVESLDRSGLWDRVVPEWSAVRDLPARSASHVFTVDRHLVQVVAESARLTTSVERPDLLLLAALVHDLGKGRDRDHSELGAELAEVICTRLGMSATDTLRIVTVVRHHLLLASVAASADPDDPVTARRVLDALGTDDRVTFDVLVALTEADSRGTGPGVWTAWKAEALRRLAATCAPFLRTAESTAPAFPDVGAETIAADITVREGEHPTRFVLDAVIDGGTDGLADVLLVLASRAIEVFHAESVRDDLGESGEIHRLRADVSTLFGAPTDPALVLQDLRALRSSSVRSRLHGTVARRGESDPRVALAAPRAWFEPDERDEPDELDAADTDASNDGVRDGGAGRSRGAGLLRVRAADRPGLLAALVEVCRAAGLTIDWTSARTLGGVVEDTLRVDGLSSTAGARQRLVDAVYGILPVPPSENDDETDGETDGEGTGGR